uniref:FAD/NAD(P)-binding domain-containing protein n=1 Tax=Chromera velia CCMP2878 TaxID=1169474 RepID=A0A0G4GNB8_9ALVE|eukprot:Cvel_4964.t1-p1 / transcript=Cvel_4964.t1 / gene=Cvel_4964 / organism=Chromera_velia_CCMP2878 / gene_product=Protein-methionine sulfoxide oxidase MICAL1, putative / transcript_product=Protein-methionine sulfoxide oxidase MICAL1, putative / location=Cvel_scaffold224:92809-96642(+) / protein_length=733 / sequence_SO=supercontig / SO=protein_coding / is_pseudo=false
MHENRAARFLDRPFELPVEKFALPDTSLRGLDALDEYEASLVSHPDLSVPTREVQHLTSDACDGPQAPSDPEGCLPCYDSVDAALQKRISLFPQAKEPKKVVVVGAGPSGLRAAIDARMLGNEVTLLEARDYFARTNVFGMISVEHRYLAAVGIPASSIGRYLVSLSDGRKVGKFTMSMASKQKYLLLLAKRIGVTVILNATAKPLSEEDKNQSIIRAATKVTPPPDSTKDATKEISLPFDRLIIANGAHSDLGDGLIGTRKSPLAETLIDWLHTPVFDQCPSLDPLAPPEEDNPFKLPEKNGETEEQEEERRKRDAAAVAPLLEEADHELSYWNTLLTEEVQVTDSKTPHLRVSKEFCDFRDALLFQGASAVDDRLVVFVGDFDKSIFRFCLDKPLIPWEPHPSSLTMGGTSSESQSPVLMPPAECRYEGGIPAVHATPVQGLCYDSSGSGEGPEWEVDRWHLEGPVLLGSCAVDKFLQKLEELTKGDWKKREALRQKLVEGLAKRFAKTRAALEKASELGRDEETFECPQSSSVDQLALKAYEDRATGYRAMAANGPTWWVVDGMRGRFTSSVSSQAAERGGGGKEHARGGHPLPLMGGCVRQERRGEGKGCSEFFVIGDAFQDPWYAFGVGGNDGIEGARAAVSCLHSGSVLSPSCVKSLSRVEGMLRRRAAQILFNIWQAQRNRKELMDDTQAEGEIPASPLLGVEGGTTVADVVKNSLEWMETIDLGL